MQCGREAIELLLIADAVDLHSPVVFVADPSADADGACARLDEPAESDSLHASGDKPGTRFQSFARHFSLPTIPKRPPRRRR